LRHCLWLEHPQENHGGRTAQRAEGWLGRFRLVSLLCGHVSPALQMDYSPRGDYSPREDYSPRGEKILIAVREGRQAMHFPPATRRVQKYFLVAAFGLMICFLGTLFLGGQGKDFNSGAGKDRFSLAEGGLFAEITATPTLPSPAAAAAPCVSYYDKENTSLKMACLVGKTWEIESVDMGGDIGLYSSLAIDKKNNAHISYYDQGNSALKYAVQAGGTWDIETVDSGEVGLYPSLVLDEAGDPWISYFGRESGVLKLAQWTGDKWNIQIVDTTMLHGRKHDDYYYKTSLVLNSQGFALIAYHHYGEDVPKLARWTGDGWDIQTIDPSKGSGKQSSLALDSKGNPGVSYYDSREKYLKFAQLVGSTWKIQVADKAYKMGDYSSLAFDSQDNPHISYFDEHNDNLRYAYWSGTAWVRQTVDIYLNTGLYPSLALDENDRAYIAYYYFSAGDLRVANWNGKSWVIKNIDTFRRVGLYPSIQFTNP
jgi:hypothetical protein